jgi:hypothetical protein
LAGRSAGPLAALGVLLFAASGVYETGFSLVRGAAYRRGDRDRGAGAGQPSFPLVRGLWLVLDGQERGLADQAASVLRSVETLAGAVDRQGRFASSLLSAAEFGHGGVALGGHR